LEERKVLSFPCRAFRENRVVFSREELIMRLNEANEAGKSCEVGFYAFSTWINLEPVKESVVLDKVIYTGKQETLEKLAERKLREGKESVLIWDGERYLLFVREEVDSIEGLAKKKEPGADVITNIEGKFTFPGFRNLKSGQMSKIIKKWRFND